MPEKRKGSPPSLERDAEGFLLYPPDVPEWARMRAALGAGPEEPVGVRTHLAPFGRVVSFRTRSRHLDLTVPDTLADDIDADLWGYLQDEAERVVAAGESLH